MENSSKKQKESYLSLMVPKMYTVNPDQKVEEVLTP